MNRSEDAILRALVLHVATGKALTDAERELVDAMATALGAFRTPLAAPPLALAAVGGDGRAVDCNGEAEMNLAQIGMVLWLVCHFIRLSGLVDKKRRRTARELVGYFEGRRVALGLDPEQPILRQYLKTVPQVRATERSEFLGGVWLPAHFLLVDPDFEHVPLDRLYPTDRSRLTAYKLCYWFAAASGRRQASVIDALGKIRTELGLDEDPRLGAMAAALSAQTGGTAALREPEKTMPLAEALAAFVVAGDEQPEAEPDAAGTTAQRLVDLIPKADRIPALAHVFDIAVKQTRLSPSALACIARIVDAIDPSEGELTGILFRHELDSGKRIKLPRSYAIDYGRPEIKYPRIRA